MARLISQKRLYWTFARYQEQNICKVRDLSPEELKKRIRVVNKKLFKLQEPTREAPSPHSTLALIRTLLQKEFQLMVIGKRKQKRRKRMPAKKKKTTPIKAPQAPQAKENTPSKKKGGPGRNRAFALGAKITVLVTENPKRKSSKAFDRFALYKTGITVQEFLDAGGTGADLTWDTRKDFIEVEDIPVE